jgi:hypothetical protein
MLLRIINENSHGIHKVKFNVAQKRSIICLKQGLAHHFILINSACTVEMLLIALHIVYSALLRNQSLHGQNR